MYQGIESLEVPGLTPLRSTKQPWQWKRRVWAWGLCTKHGAEYNVKHDKQITHRFIRSIYQPCIILRHFINELLLFLPFLDCQC